MTRRTTFLQDCGIYGKQERVAYKTHPASPFSVFKDDTGAWTIGQDRSGLVMTAIIPSKLVRSRARLLLFIEAMETECALDCAMVSLVDGEWPDEIKPHGQALVDWARGYVG